MQDWTLALIGLGIGLAVAAPVGPVNIMCVHRAVQKGFWAGLTAGAGTVAGDALFASVAAFGITAISTFIAGHAKILQIIGGFILLAFGLSTGLKAPAVAEVADENDTALSMVGAAITSFIMTITNPATMFGYFALFGGIGQIGHGPGDYAAAGILVLAVVTGSLMWWVVIAALVSRFREHINDRWLHNMNKVSGFALALCGVAVLGSFVKDHWF